MILNISVEMPMALRQRASPDIAQHRTPKHETPFDSATTSVTLVSVNLLDQNPAAIDELMLIELQGFVWR
jgi:hypothetical protein